MFNEFIKCNQEDNSFPKKYLSRILNIKNIQTDFPLSFLKTLIPLPNCFLLDSDIYQKDDTIIKEENTYKFVGKNGKRLIYGNIKLPYFTNKKCYSEMKIKYPLPFTFPVYIDKHNVELLHSNVFFYETTLLPEININNIHNNLFVGFGPIDIPFNEDLDNFHNTISIDICNSSIIFNEEIIDLNENININDTVGCGLYYINSHVAIPFFTLNKKMIFYNKQYKIRINEPLIPIISYNHSNSIKVNFSSEPFKYDIKKFIIKNSNYILSLNNTYLINCEYNLYRYDLSKIRKQINERQTRTLYTQFDETVLLTWLTILPDLTIDDID